jgi:hypothetical protein
VLGETRGGIVVAKTFEWGGYEADNKTWGFDKNRPGWAKPLHQLMVDNKVAIFFQGHDHLFAREMLDGLVYQEVPMPSDSTYIIGTLANADAFQGDTLSSSGHLRVTVASDKATVEYIRAWMPADASATRVNGSVAYSYTVLPNTVATIPAMRQAPAAGPLTRLSVKAVHRHGVMVCFLLSSPQAVEITMYDLSGRVVLARSPMLMNAGLNALALTPDDAGQSQLGQGAYVLRVTAGAVVQEVRAFVL